MVVVLSAQNGGKHIGFYRFAAFLSALGDPLIKGLTEVANQRPENPIIFLANFLLNYANKGGVEQPSNNVN